MDINEIIPLLHRSEDVHLEYKKEFPKSATDMGKEMAALANTDGGVILIGVDDGGQLVGVDNPDQVMQRLVGVAQQVCRPPICPDTSITSFGSDVSVVWTKVERNRDELCLVEDKCYVRYGSCSQPVKDGRELKWLLESQGLSVAVAIPCTPLKPPVTKGFVGRNDELSVLESLLSDSEVSVVLIEGIGGIGKTTLSAKFADVIAGNGWYSFWMHCLPETSFDGIAAELANHSRSRGDIHLTEILDDTQGSPLERARRYTDALADLPYALFLDDFHLAVDVRIGQFIACMEERSRKMKTFLLVRKRPKMIGSLRPVGVREVRLSDGLDKESCGRLLTQCGISFGEEELSEIWRHTGKGHPKALQVLAVRARSMPIKALLSSLPVFKEELIEVWLGPLLDELSPDIRSALIELSVFNRPVSLSLVQGLLGSEDISAILVDLVDRFLIEYVNDEQVQMHSLVRDFCYGILDDKEARHRFAADLYIQNACISTDQQTLDDSQLSLLFAAWWHLTRAKEDDRAAEVVRSWLRRPLMDKGRYDQVMLLLENTDISSQEQQEWFDLDKARIRSLWGSKEDAEILVYPLISSSSLESL